MKQLIFLIAIVAQAQVTYNPFTDRFDFKAQAGAVNASNTVAGASTTQNVDITSLNLSTLATAIMACKSPTAPVAFTYSTAGSAPITTVVFTYSSTSDVTCTVNSNGGPGPTGPTGPAGTGDVVGPASSTDSVVALFSGTTGKLLKNSTIASSTIVGGAASLTTAGAIPFVVSAGVLGLDAGLSYSAAGAINRLTLQDGASQSSTATLKGQWPSGQEKYTLGGVNNSLPTFGLNNAAGTEVFSILNAGEWRIAAVTAVPIAIRTNNVERLRVNGTTGNLLIATPTDGGYKMDIAASGTNGTFRCYDQTATTGSTKMIVRAGAGQSGNIFEVQGAAGAALFSVSGTGSVSSAATITSGGDLSLVSTGGIYWASRSVLTSPADGAIKLSNYSQTDFNRLQLGGTTSSFPAIKRSGTAIQIRLADDSAFAPLQAMTVQWGSGTKGTCDSSTRGMSVFTYGGTGVGDSGERCVKLADDTYSWTPEF